MTTPQVERAAQQDSSLAVGGLSLQSWQVVIWVLAGAVFCGILLALAAAYYNHRKGTAKVEALATYPRNSVAAQRERLLSTIRGIDATEKIVLDQQRRSLTQEQFLNSKRAGRRLALAGSSMIAEAGSFARNPLLGSMRSGVTGVSTPCLSEEETSPELLNNKLRYRTESLNVELGDMDSSPESVRSGVTLVQTPIGSVLVSDSESESQEAISETYL